MKRLVVTTGIGLWPQAGESPPAGDTTNLLSEFCK